MALLVGEAAGEEGVAEMEEEGLSPLESATDEANVLRLVTLANGDLDAVLAVVVDALVLAALWATELPAAPSPPSSARAAPGTGDIGG